MGALSVPNAAAIALLLLSVFVLVGLLIVRGRRGPRPAVRPLAAFRELQAQIGRTAESGGAIHLALGSGGLGGGDTVTSLATFPVVEAIAAAAVSYGVTPTITVGDVTLVPLAQDALRRAYERRGLAELYDPARVRFVAPSPLAFAAGAANAVSAEGVMANVLVGAFGPEVTLITDASARRDLPQLAAADDLRSIGALYPATDRLAVGEELYAAGAQLTGERRYLIGLMTQDILRVVIVLAILGAGLLALAR